MPAPMTHEFGSYLRSGERLLWAGRPHQGFVWRRGALLLLPGLLLWTGLGVGFGLLAVVREFPGPFLFLTAGYVALGALYVLRRFVSDVRYRRGLFYGLTDQRVMILRNDRLRHVWFVPLARLHTVTLMGEATGRGSIVFGPERPLAALAAGVQPPALRRFAIPRFDLIADAAAVHAEIIAARTAAQAGRTRTSSHGQ